MFAKAACSWMKASSAFCLVYGGFSSNLLNASREWKPLSDGRSLFFPASKKAKMTASTCFMSSLLWVDANGTGAPSLQLRITDNVFQPTAQPTARGVVAQHGRAAGC